MSTVINTNVMSLNAQRNLSASGADLATSLQRLSSGMRINSAKDDAAGLAISQRFTTQIRGLDQAARNANDGISLAQTAEGALAEIGNNLQRIRELAVQSRNATNSESDRKALDAEVQQLMAEIQRVAETTNFNDVKLLDGSFQKQSFQVGANQGETIDIAAIVNANIDALGVWKTPLVVSEATVTGTALADQDPGDTFAAIGEGDLVINGVDVELTASAAGATGAEQAARVAAAINAAGIAGVTAEVNDDGEVVLRSAEDIEITVAGAGAASSGLATTTAQPTETGGEDRTGFQGMDIKTVEGADNMILAMDAALTQINTARADMGAVQNRFTSVIANLSTSIENLSAARSRIQDADFAKESAQLSRNQILQQAGTAMLAQANQATQSVLQLLR